MTRDSILEYTEAMRWQYLQATKKGKRRILDEFTKVTGYHRKAVIRILRQEKQPRASKKRGCPSNIPWFEPGFTPESVYGI